MVKKDKFGKKKGINDKKEKIGKKGINGKKEKIGKTNML